MFDDLLRTGFGVAQREDPPASYTIIALLAKHSIPAGGGKRSRVVRD